MSSGAIVVGGASGLGEATARRLAHAGHHVTIADLNADRGRPLADAIGARYVKVDVRDADRVADAVEHAAEGAPLRVTVCCAGVGLPQKLLSRGRPHPAELFERVVRINLLGTFHVLRAAAATMSRNEPDDDGQRGVIVTTSSIAATEGQVGQVSYSASKGGIEAMTLPAARELAAVGVRVVTIAPGMFDTPIVGVLSDEAMAALDASALFPARRGQPDEYASLVETVVTNHMVNGCTLRLDGAVRLAPR